mmetsp:Transcript_50981/g.119169  ORF Transcript_50981/g.119169 Transcript_50981/m.119169 type:complete len:282 (+) Transcript_50981:31-876(+)
MLLLVPIDSKFQAVGPGNPKRRASAPICCLRRDRSSAYNLLSPVNMSSSGTSFTFSWMKENLNSCSYLPFTVVSLDKAATKSLLPTTRAVAAELAKTILSNSPCVSRPLILYFCLWLKVNSKPENTCGAVSMALSSTRSRSRSTSSFSIVSTILTLGIAKSSVHPRFVPRSSNPYPTNHKSGKSTIPVISAKGQSRPRCLLNKQHVNMSSSVCVPFSWERKHCFMSCIVFPLSNNSSSKTILCGFLDVASKNFWSESSAVICKPPCSRSLRYEEASTKKTE